MRLELELPSKTADDEISRLQEMLGSQELEKYRAVDQERSEWKERERRWNERERCNIEQLEAELKDAKVAMATTVNNVAIESVPQERTQLLAPSLSLTYPEGFQQETQDGGVVHLPSNTTVESASGRVPPSPTTIPVQHLPSLRPFKGERRDKEDFEEWIERFEDMSQWCEWDESCRLTQLRMSLEGTARMFYKSCAVDTQRSYSALKQALSRRFTPLKMTAVQTSLFHNRRQETVDEYAQDLCRLFHRAYPATSVSSEEESLGVSILANQFISGLENNLKEKLTGMTGSLEELLCKACFEEAKRRE